ncbi:MAG: insulinase family protein [Anaerolineae bacterium]|nr:insulinase family protein [Anaerolineae bacterium]
MTIIHGFELVREKEIPELNTRAKLYRHVETGARLLSLENDDENKVFGITFRTPPPDSTGLPHIMEHAVLCGSRKYPVKEPFVELMKGSLNTFLNALTFSDKTSYPVASQNLQDFYNLVDVYLDAVFYPRITPETLQQEGWHYELEDLNAPLTYKGVVFNEMKGAYSSPDNLIARYNESVLFPDNTYSFDSGGDPEVIPNLTYTQFKTFHETYYHPSNAFIFFSGDDAPFGNGDSGARLALIQAYLKDYQSRTVDSTVPLQPQFDSPRRKVYPYPVSVDAEDPKAFICVNWLLPENNNPTLTLALEILSYTLVSTSASPLRKALIDSGLGEEVIGDGLDDSVRQLYFSTGLKGVVTNHVEKVEILILETLHSLVENGIDPDMIEAAINTIEFNLREQNFGTYPRGIVQMLRALTTWLHDGDPLAPLAFETPLAEVKAHYATEGTAYFEGLIQTYLLNNTHRVTVILKPDTNLQQQQDEAETARLVKTRASMSETELKAVLESAARLKTLQETPDSPEALATIPCLTLDDLDKETKIIPTEHSQENGVQVMAHDLFTNGILYFDLGFNLHTLPQELLPYSALFGDVLLEIGTETEDFVKLTQRIGRKTGGIETTTYNAMIRDTDTAAAWLFLRSKATMTQVEELFAILRDILLTVKLDNPVRFMQMLLEKKARLEAQLVPGGHRMAIYRLRAKFNEADWATEYTRGISYLFFLRDLIKQTEQNWPDVLQKLEMTRNILVNRNALLCNVTLDAVNWTEVQPKLRDFLAALPADRTANIVTWMPDYTLAPEGLTIPAKVNYVAKGANLYSLGYTRHGSIEVILNYLRATWLWEKIRVQGGAYGGFCLFDPHSGVFAYASYRDPNLLNTLTNYDKTSNFLRTLGLTDDELVRSIIGAIGNVDTYQLPDAKGYSAMARALIGYTDEARQQYRDEILTTNANNFHALAEILESANAIGRIAVLGAAETIEAANAEREEKFLVTKVM